jgi:outer membrane protein OmpA-like peptidoglycan-associated protein
VSERTAAPRETKGTPRVASGAGLSLRAPANAVPPGVHAVLRSPGRPLDPDARAFMEPRLGFDFSRVRVHSDAEAAASASAVKALAYTFGHHVVFGAGHYVPRSADGQRLLAHELTHVVQQAGGAPSSALVIGQPDRFELAAGRAADAVAAGKADLEPLGSGEKPPGIQCQPAGSSGFTPPPSPETKLQLSLSSLGSFTIADFALDKADLPEAQLSLLAVHAKIILTLLNSDPLATVVVTGHTDASGSEKHNLALGLQRAEAAKRALVAAGVLASGITTKSAGESQPIVATQAHEPRNRRVEVRFEPSPQSPPGAGPKAGLPGILPPLSPGGKAPPPVPRPPHWTPEQFTPGSPPVPKPPAGILQQYTPEIMKTRPDRPPSGPRALPPETINLPEPIRTNIIKAWEAGDEPAVRRIVDEALRSKSYSDAMRATLEAIIKVPGERTFKLPPITF